jgi:hypothetical protein
MTGVKAIFSFTTRNVPSPARDVIFDIAISMQLKIALVVITMSITSFPNIDLPLVGTYDRNHINLCASNNPADKRLAILNSV